MHHHEKLHEQNMAAVDPPDPPKPDYFRVKIWRRLLQVGAIAVKQSVYLLPPTDQAYEDFGWILREII